MNFAHWLMVYFLMDAVMWGGGAIAWDKVGVGALVLDVDGSKVEANESTTGDLEKIGGPIQEAQTSVSGGGLIAILYIVFKVLGFIFWPIAVTISQGMPIEVIVLLGGTPSIGMLGAAIQMIRRS